MQKASRVNPRWFIAALLLLLTVNCARADGPWQWLGFGSRGGGCGCGVAACEPGCEPSCGAAPACGCAGGCVNGRQFACQTWDGCCERGPQLCGCTDAHGNCVRPGCGCGRVDSCGCDSCGPSCGCEPDCGVGPTCGGGCDSPGDGYCCEALFNCLFGCTGCSSEFYWSEWHNDPPRCCDPCDRCGNWIGPSAGYRAPYAHPYAVHGAARPALASQPGLRPVPSAPVARRPTPATNRSFQR
jgi:hypothetical protein